MVEKVKNFEEIQVSLDGKNSFLNLLLAKLVGPKGNTYNFEARLSNWDVIIIEHWEAHYWRKIIKEKPQRANGTHIRR